MPCPLTPGSRRPACCGVRSEPDPLALTRARCAERSDGLDGAQARLWGRLFDIVDEYLREEATMKIPPIVSPQEWDAAREELLVEEKKLTRARDALAAKRRRMPWMAVGKEYRF